MKVAAFTVMLPDLTLEEAAGEIKAAGYDGAEWRVAHIPKDVRNDAPSGPQPLHLRADRNRGEAGEVDK